MKLQELNVLLEAAVDTVGMCLLEISADLLRRAAVKGQERAQNLQSFLARKYPTSAHVSPTVLNYRAQAARFVNRANKKSGKPYRDLSDAAVKRANPQLHEHLRRGRISRTFVNQTLRKHDLGARVKRWQQSLAPSWKEVAGVGAAVVGGRLALHGAKKLYSMHKAAKVAQARARIAAKVRTVAKAAGAVGAGAYLLRRRKKER